MKSCSVLLTIFISLNLWANDPRGNLTDVTVCDEREYKMLNTVDGPQQQVVILDELLSRDAKPFKCEVQQESFFFPADCGRHVYSYFHYTIQSGRDQLRLKVKSGRTSCVPNSESTTISQFELNE